MVNYPPTTFLHMIVCELASRREEEWPLRRGQDSKFVFEVASIIVCLK